MFKKEEEKLTDYKNSYDQIPIALDSIDQAIMAGFQKAKAEEKRKPRAKKWMMGFAAAAVLFLGFFSSVRYSTAFADYVSTIPGMEKIVDLIRFDKGLMSAVENDYYQEIGASVEKNGLKVTIDGAIADEKGIVLFYSLSSKNKQMELTIDKTEIKSREGEALDLSTIAYNPSQFSETGKTSNNGSLQYFFEKPFTSKDFEISLTIKGDIHGEYKIPFTLEKEIAKNKEYKLNQTVSIEGQKITFVSATIQPLRVAVHVKMDPKNSKRILNFEDLRIVDENGETWGKIANGISSTKISDEEEIIYLQSNYFRNPKEMYLVMNKLQAIDKNETNVTVDIKNQKILKQPKSKMVSEVKVEGDHITFTMPTKEDFPYFIFIRGFDAEGNEINYESDFSSLGENNIKTFGITIPELQKVKGPISFELGFYPEWIKGDAKIKIK